MHEDHTFLADYTPPRTIVDANFHAVEKSQPATLVIGLCATVLSIVCVCVCLLQDSR